MEFKRIIVLANSMKKKGRCVAGRELGEDETDVGHWLRPISNVEEGTLMPRHMAVDRGKPLEVLHIVDVPLTRYADDRCHPEDWEVGKEKWRYVDRFDSGGVASLEETPGDLWLEDRSRTDRVECDFLLRRRHHQSLHLIRPRNLRLRLWKEYNADRGYNQKKTRAVFNYSGVEFNLSLTDPVATERHCTSFPDVGKPAQELVLPFGDHCLLCVSLTPMFHGYHYKVVATVLELQ